MVTGIHHTALRVDDFDRALKFYVEALGLKVYRTWGEGAARAAMLDTGAGYIELFAGGRKPEGENGFFHLALASDDVDGDYQKALNAGAVSKMVPQDFTIPVTSGAPFAARAAFVFAPTGEIVEFIKDR